MLPSPVTTRNTVGVGLSKAASDDRAAHRSWEGRRQGAHISPQGRTGRSAGGGCLGVQAKGRHLPLQSAS